MHPTTVTNREKFDKTLIEDRIRLWVLVAVQLNFPVEYAVTIVVLHITIIMSHSISRSAFVLSVESSETLVLFPFCQNSLQATNFSYIKQYSNQSGLNATLGYGFHFQHRNSRTFPIESLAHDSGRTSVRAEYGYPKGSPNTNS
jgi:hypothetical protein